jgi:hypothetical protein
MKIQRGLAVVCTVSLFLGPVQAATIPPAALTQAVTQVSADSTLISGWINDQFKDAVAFNSTAGDVVPSQLKIFGIEAGVEGVVTSSKVDIDGFHQLPTTLIDTTKINMYDRMPFPSVIGQAKVGLPFGLDAGVRIGGIPSKSFDNGTTHYDIANSIFGLDLRKKIIDEGITRPFGLTMGLNYTHANGHIDASTPYTANTSYTYQGQTYTPTLNATGSERTDWNTNSIGLQAILNKQILIFNPYIGASVNHNSGTVSSSINNVGTVTLADPLGILSPASEAVAAGGGASSSPNEWDVRGLAGMEITILPFVKLGINGAVANQNRLGGAISLRIQFR